MCLLCFSFDSRPPPPPPPPPPHQDVSLEALHVAAAVLLHLQHLARLGERALSLLQLELQLLDLLASHLVDLAHLAVDLGAVVQQLLLQLLLLRLQLLDRLLLLFDVHLQGGVNRSNVISDAPKLKHKAS